MRLIYTSILSIFLLVASLFSVQAEEQKNIRLMSYNIRNGIGMDGKKDLSRIAQAIVAQDPDVVALQEIDSMTNRSSKRDILNELAKELHMYATYAPAINFDGGKYGIGILSKKKPLATHRIPLPGREEKRTFVWVEFRDYVFGSVHLSLTEEDQIASVDLIKQEIEKFDKPVFIGGDFNAIPHSTPMRLFAQDFAILSDTLHQTCPADQPDACIDYLLVNKAYATQCKVQEKKVIKETVASDHRPIRVIVSNPTPPIFKTKPYLQNPTGEGITVSWLTHSKVYSWVKYGTSPQALDQKAHTLVDGQVICNNYQHKIRLKDLKPGVTYYYRAYSQDILAYHAYSKRFGETDSSEVYSFQIPKADEKDFTALVFNDLHKQNVTLQALCKQLEGIDYDFVVFNGDCIDDPANEEQAVSFLKVLNESVKAEENPVFYLRGNHEIRNAYSIELRKLFDYVGDRTYSAFNWGTTRFVQLDCGEDKPDETPVYYGLNDFSELRREQVDFLKAELKSKAFKKAERRILIHHIPVYESSDNYNPCFDLWHPLLKNQPFDLSINAHLHAFAYYSPSKESPYTFPVLIGGGPSLKNATVILLEKKGKQFKVKVINAEGNTLLEQNL